MRISNFLVRFILAVKGAIVNKFTYEVQSTMIFLGYRISNFVGNSYTQKLNKEQTKQSNTIGITSGINRKWCQLFLYFFITFSFLFQITPFVPPHGGVGRCF